MREAKGALAWVRGGRAARRERGVPVGPFAKSIITTAILVVVVPNTRLKGRGERLNLATISRVIVVVVIGNRNGGLSIIRLERICHGFSVGISKLSRAPRGRPGPFSSLGAWRAAVAGTLLRWMHVGVSRCGDL